MLVLLKIIAHDLFLELLEGHFLGSLEFDLHQGLLGGHLLSDSSQMAQKHFLGVLLRLGVLLSADVLPGRLYIRDGAVVDRQRVLRHQTAEYVPVNLLT